MLLRTQFLIVSLKWNGISAACKCTSCTSQCDNTFVHAIEWSDWGSSVVKLKLQKQLKSKNETLLHYCYYRHSDCGLNICIEFRDGSFLSSFIFWLFEHFFSTSTISRKDGTWINRFFDKTHVFWLWTEEIPSMVLNFVQYYDTNFSANYITICKKLPNKTVQKSISHHWNISAIATNPELYVQSAYTLV